MEAKRTMEEQKKAAWGRYWDAIGRNATAEAAEMFGRAMALESSRRTTTKVAHHRRTTQRYVVEVQELLGGAK